MKYLKKDNFCYNIADCSDLCNIISIKKMCKFQNDVEPKYNFVLHYIPIMYKYGIICDANVNDTLFLKRCSSTADL